MHYNDVIRIVSNDCLLNLLFRHRWKKTSKLLVTGLSRNDPIAAYVITHSDQLLPTNSRPIPLQWRHNGRNGVSNHHLHHCLLNRFFRRRSKKTSQLRGTVLCARNSSVTDEFSAQMAINAENVSIWWRHHGCMPVIHPAITGENHQTHQKRLHWFVVPVNELP